MENKTFEMVIRVMTEKIESLENELLFKGYRIEQLEGENNRLAETCAKLTDANARLERTVQKVEEYADELVECGANANKGEALDL